MTRDFEEAVEKEVETIWGPCTRCDGHHRTLSLIVSL